MTRVSSRGKQSAGSVKARLGSNGDLFVVWDETNQDGVSQLFLSVRRRGKWSKPVQVSEDAVRREVFLPGHPAWPVDNYHLYYDIAPVDESSAWICWSREEPAVDVACRPYADGLLGGIVKVADRASGLTLGVGPDGTVHLLYEADDRWTPDGRRKSLPAFHERRLLYVFGSKGSWSPPRMVAEHVFVETAGLSVDLVGRAHAYWQELAGGDAQLVHALLAPVRTD